MTELSPLLEFLTPTGRLEVTIRSLECILDLSGSKEGIAIIYQTPNLIESLIKLLKHQNDAVVKLTMSCFVNLTSEEDYLLNMLVNTFPINLAHVLDPQSNIADSCIMCISNLTRTEVGAFKFVEIVDDLKSVIGQLVKAFVDVEYNKKDNHLHNLGMVFCNLCQISSVQDIFMETSTKYLEKLLPFIGYQQSSTRRQGIIGMVKNCCFDHKNHQRLLNDIDVLPYLLLPLAGNEQYDDEDNEKLPLDLQYLPQDKKREESPQNRCMLLEALIQLCATKMGREYLREKNSYIILRDLHTWEKDSRVVDVCESLVDILIRTEEEIGHDNLKAVKIPEDILPSLL